MADLTISQFKGSVPRVAPHLIQVGMAHEAVNCNFQSGRLESWRTMESTGEIRTLPSRAVYLEKSCCWEFVGTCQEVVQINTDCTRALIIGIKSANATMPPQIARMECNQTSYRRAGFDPPRFNKVVDNVVITEDPGGGLISEKDNEAILLGIQFENEDGHRSAIGAAASSANISNNNADVTGDFIPANIPPEAVKIRLYFARSGDVSGAQSGKQFDTTWMLAKEFDISSSVPSGFSFTPADDLYYEALEEDIVMPPPPNLQGAVWLAEDDALAGFVGNRIYFTETGNYENWCHWMDLDDNIRGIAVSNRQIYVATDGNPYVIGAESSCEGGGCHSVIKLPFHIPMVAFGNHHITATNEGAVYPGARGLVYLAGNRQPVYITWAWYTEEEWQRLNPMSVIPIQHDGKLFVFSDTTSFVVSTPSGPEAGWDAQNHSHLSFEAGDNELEVFEAFVPRSGRLFLHMRVKGFNQYSEIFEWNAGDDYLEHKWVSHEHVERLPIGLASGIVEFDDGEESITIECDRKEVLQRDLRPGKVFRLPMWAQGQRWRVTLEGKGKVSLLSISETMQSLNK